MKSFYTFIFVFLTFSSPRNYAQLAPDISIISADVKFIKEVISNLSNIPAQDGKIQIPVLGTRRHFEFEIKLQTFIQEKDDAQPLPIHIRLISPSKKVTVYTLENDTSLLLAQKIYDYSFGFQTKELGWFTIELGIFPSQNNPGEEIIFDNATVYLAKE